MPNERHVTTYGDTFTVNNYTAAVPAPKVSPGTRSGWDNNLLEREVARKVDLNSLQDEVDRLASVSELAVEEAVKERRCKICLLKIFPASSLDP